MQTDGVPIHREIAEAVEAGRRIAFMLTRAEKSLGIPGHGPLHDRLEAVLQSAMHMPGTIEAGVYRAIHRLRGKR